MEFSARDRVVPPYPRAARARMSEARGDSAERASTPIASAAVRNPLDVIYIMAARDSLLIIHNPISLPGGSLRLAFRFAVRISGVASLMRLARTRRAYRFVIDPLERGNMGIRSHRYAFETRSDSLIISSNLHQGF
jgi:hypothetical protein